MFFLVVGDVKSEEVVAQIREAYAKAKARSHPSVVLPAEPRQTAAREVIEEAAIELGHLHFAWHIPDLRHPDVAALDVLAVLLGSGHSSRLYQEVREKQGVVHHADAWTYNPGNPGLFGLSAVVDADKFEPARAALLAEIEKLKLTPVSEAERQKAVKQFISATLATRKTMQGQAQDLGGSWLATGDVNFSQRYLANVKRVTPADLQRVAREYLTTENRTLYALLPNGTAPKVVGRRRNEQRAGHSEIHPGQRSPPAREGGSSSAVRGIPRRVPGRRVGRERRQQRHYATSVPAGRQRHPDAQRGTNCQRD